MSLTFRLLFVLSAMIAMPAMAAESLAGRARVVDGDTLQVEGVKVRLFGVDAPELDQTCDRDGQVWECGQAARIALADIVGRHRVVCAVQTVDRYGRDVAVCTADGEDVGAHLVRKGMAIAYRRYSGRYVNAETAARREGVGLWSSTYMEPEAYRHAGQVSVGSNESCKIKGNIGRTGAHIYHLPGQADYGSTRINLSKGEQWFCSEAQAQAAGFRRAAR